MMWAVRKPGTNELLAKGIKGGFEAAKRPEDVWLFRRESDAKYRAEDNMHYVFFGVLEPKSWLVEDGRYFPLETVKVEITLNVCD